MVYSVSLHWLTVAVVVGLTVLGLWMVDLDYYSEWYKTGPDIHRSIGVILGLLLLFRIVWRYYSPPPAPLQPDHAW